MARIRPAAQFAKGSDDAKAHMGRLRAMRGGGRKGCRQEAKAGLRGFNRRLSGVPRGKMTKALAEQFARKEFGERSLFARNLGVGHERRLTRRNARKAKAGTVSLAQTMDMVAEPTNVSSSTGSGMRGNGPYNFRRIPAEYKETMRGYGKQAKIHGPNRTKNGIKKSKKK